MALVVEVADTTANLEASVPPFSDLALSPDGHARSCSALAPSAEEH